MEKLHGEFLLSEGISTDTRQGVDGTLFFALKGERFDGNRFVADALKGGARLAVTGDRSRIGQPGVWYSDSPLALLQQLAAFHRDYIAPRVLAITGSNGKTTTKELISAILGRRYSVLSTQGNLNNHIGVPLTLLSLDKEEVAVVEMGANHPGEIGTLAGIAKPDLGLITNVGKAHLEGFGSVRGVLEAKAELYDHLAGTGGKAMVDGEDRMLMEKASASGVETLVVGEEGDLPVTGRIIGQSPFLEVELNTGNGLHRVATRMVGAYNLQNIRMAAAAGYYFGIPGNDIAGAIASYSPENYRSQVLEGGRNRVILDSYNANPSSMREAISSFMEYAKPPRMLILGDMAELGVSSREEHASLARWIGTLPVDRVLLAGPRFREAFATIEPTGNMVVYRDTGELEESMRSNPPGGFHILLKGSRVMELERLAPYLVASL